MLASIAVISSLPVQEPLRKAERRKFRMAFKHPLSRLMGRCFRKAPPRIFAAIVNPFSFAPRFITGANPG